MIDRFNFYDVYGYLIPGAVLLVLLIGPYALIMGKLPEKDIVDAVVIIIMAYVVGHLIRTISEPAMAFYPKPHDLMLNANDPTFSSELKKRLYEGIQRRFGLIVADELSTNPESKNQLTKRRQEAFFLCRSLLLQKEGATYAEQFQGMYALMRGLTAATLLGVAYIWGWALGCAFSWMNCGLWYAACIAGMVFLFFATPAFFRPRRDLSKVRSKKSSYLWIAICLAFPIGAAIAKSQSASPPYFWLLLSTGLGGSFAAWCFYEDYKYFARLFAETVYRDFLTISAAKAD